MELPLYFRRNQHSVGQGAFCSGNIQLDQEQYNYVYDCGSLNSRPLNTEITRYIDTINASGQIDTLFISHFHKDHIAGLNRLLPNYKVEWVVLPYLQPFERLYLIAERASQSALNYDEIRLIADPNGWLGDRGVDRVLVVTPGGDIGPTPGGTSPNAIAPQDQSGIQLFVKDLKGVEDEDTNRASTGSTQPTVFLLPHTTPLPLVNKSHQILNWEFFTFVHPDSEGVAKFRTAMLNAFPQLIGQDERSIRLRLDLILPILMNSSDRQKLINAYRVFGNLNHTSLCLFSGPAERPIHCEYSVNNSPWIARRDWPYGNPQQFLALRYNRAGWLGTGDASLKIAERRQAFLHHYESRLNRCAMMIVPHHGSINNHHHSLYETGIRLFIASARDGNRKHPAPEVLRTIRRVGGSLFLTTEDPLTEVCENGYLMTARKLS